VIINLHLFCLHILHRFYKISVMLLSVWTNVDSCPLCGLNFIDIYYIVIIFLGDGSSSLGLGMLL
jgi:hypothetical protein